MRRTGLRREVGQKAEKLCQFRITYQFVLATRRKMKLAFNFLYENGIKPTIVYPHK